MLPLQGDPRAGRVVIEGCWGASFHRIAYATQAKHGQHHDNHSRLGTYLRSMGELMAADRWEDIDHSRQGGMYGTRTSPAEVERAIELLEHIRNLATS